MLRNYIITAIRIFLRQKTYSFINILGLSIGLASSLLIAIYIFDELSYDRYFNDADRIYRVGITEKFQGKEINYTNTGAPLAEAMRNEIPEVVSSLRIGHFEHHPVRYKEKTFVEEKFFVADSTLFQFFNYTMIEGNPKTCLCGPNKIAISQSTANKYFGYKGIGDISPIGKLLTVGDKNRVVEVTGVFKNVPHNTHFKFDMVMSAESWNYAAHDDCWACYGLHTYFKINDVHSLPAVEKKLSNFVDKNVLPRIEKDLNVTVSQLKERGDKVNFFVQPLTTIHLQSHFDNELEPNGDIRYIYIFGAIAVFIILIACINFMNLATARATSRAKEVGVRKSIGAAKSWLIQQFMIESFLYVLLSTVLAFIIVVALLHSFNSLSGKNLGLDSLENPSILSGTFLFVIIVGLLSGSYPAFYLTSFKPVSVLKGATLPNAHRSVFRSGLVVFQFAISIALIISTLMINKQLTFIQEQNLGFERENMIKISQTSSLGNNANAFKNELLRHPEFINASYTYQLPPHIATTGFMKSEGSNELYAIYFAMGDYDHLKTMGYKMKSGRFFSKDFRSDSTAVIINETCAKLIGYENFEGRHVTFNDDRKWNVIGIVKDFNFESLRGEIRPLALFINESPEMMAVRITPGNVANKIKLAESVWKGFANGVPFQYSFMDEDFNALFHTEQKMSKIFWVFTCMAIFIACLGLFGLITFTSGQRTKEIGIRKVMGATVAHITLLLSGNLIRLVALAFVIAIPITWYGINQWLQGFAYRTSFDFIIVLISGLAGIVIAIATVSYKSYKAASGNPVDSLRSE